MIPIEDGFGDDLPVARDGPLDFSTPYVRTHFPETWLWIDTKTRYEIKRKLKLIYCFYFFVLVLLCIGTEKQLKNVVLFIFCYHLEATSEVGSPPNETFYNCTKQSNP